MTGVGFSPKDYSVPGQGEVAKVAKRGTTDANRIVGITPPNAAKFADGVDPNKKASEDIKPSSLSRIGNFIAGIVKAIGSVLLAIPAVLCAAAFQSWKPLEVLASCFDSTGKSFEDAFKKFDTARIAHKEAQGTPTPENENKIPNVITARPKAQVRLESQPKISSTQSQAIDVYKADLEKDILATRKYLNEGNIHANNKLKHAADHLQKIEKEYTALGGDPKTIKGKEVKVNPVEVNPNEKLENALFKSKSLLSSLSLQLDTLRESIRPKGISGTVSSTEVYRLEMERRTNPELRKADLEKDILATREYLNEGNIHANNKLKDAADYLQKIEKEYTDLGGDPKTIRDKEVKHAPPDPVLKAKEELIEIVAGMLRKEETQLKKLENQAKDHISYSPNDTSQKNKDRNEQLICNKLDAFNKGLIETTGKAITLLKEQFRSM